MPTVSVAARSYPVGITSVTRTIPGGTDFSTLSFTVDLSAWTNPATTRVGLVIEASNDGGATWTPLDDTRTEYAGPDWLNRRGVSGPVMRATTRWNTMQLVNAKIVEVPAVRRLGQIRASLIVEGTAPVTLGVTVTVA